MEQWPEPVERVAAVLRTNTVDARIEQFHEGTKTAADAAKAVGCEPSQIVKSLVFVADGHPVMALLPGNRRADPAKIAAKAGAAQARVADSHEVRAATGFEPGGVSPFPLPSVTQVLLDRELLQHEIVWIGAGSPKHVAGLSPLDLARLSGAELADLAEA